MQGIRGMGSANCSDGAGAPLRAAVLLAPVRQAATAHSPGPPPSIGRRVNGRPPPLQVRDTPDVAAPCALFGGRVPQEATGAGGGGQPREGQPSFHCSPHSTHLKNCVVGSSAPRVANSLKYASLQLQCFAGHGTARGHGAGGRPTLRDPTCGEKCGHSHKDRWAPKMIRAVLNKNKNSFPSTFNEKFIGKMRQKMAIFWRK